MLLFFAMAACLKRLQVAQVLLTLPYSFAQLGMASGVLFQVFYGLMGSWTAYLISTLYLEYRSRVQSNKLAPHHHNDGDDDGGGGGGGGGGAHHHRTKNVNVDFKHHVIQVLASENSIYYKLWSLLQSSLLSWGMDIVRNLECILYILHASESVKRNFLF